MTFSARRGKSLPLFTHKPQNQALNPKEIVPPPLP